MGLLDQWNKPKQSIKGVLQKAMKEKKSVLIKYRKYDGTSSERKLSELEFNNEFQAVGFHNAHIKAFCHLRKENRTFKISRIISANVIE
jgi:predicted DNA-binding transcriptional regulator YafY